MDMEMSLKQYPRKPAKAGTPLVNVVLPVSHTKKSFSLREDVVKLIADYALFLSEHHGKTIEEDRVIEGLTESLRRDKLFGAWQKGRTHG